RIKPGPELIEKEKLSHENETLNRPEKEESEHEERAMPFLAEPTIGNNQKPAEQGKAEQQRDKKVAIKADAEGLECGPETDWQIRLESEKENQPQHQVKKKKRNDEKAGQ